MIVMSIPYVLLDKKVGQTPLAAIDAWREANPAYATVSATYAGRLDPMAEGKLLVLVGDECRLQDRYRNLDKEYEIEVLLDLSTDTGDVLGVPTYAETETVPKAYVLAKVLHAQTGTHTVPYPSFSSKTVAGKPLFQYSLEGTLNSIEIPSHAETIYRISELGYTELSKGALRERIQAMLSLAPRADAPTKRLGEDFRQDRIRAAWDDLFDAIPDRSFFVLRLRVTCASGTYMRTLASRIGSALGTKGMALSIRRTRVGKFLRLLRIWTREFR
jgi:tRNA pseudouridine55 synthase